MTATTPAEKIRVLVVDDHVVVRAGLKALLDSEADMHVVGEAANEEEAVKVYATLEPDVTVMDLRLPNSSGLDVVNRLHQKWPNAHIVMFSSFTREEDIYSALKTGVC